MKVKSIISLILVLLLAVCTVACTPQAQQDGGTSEQTLITTESESLPESSPEDAEKSITLYAEGK